jgi:hypothetical protein
MASSKRSLMRNLEIGRAAFLRAGLTAERKNVGDFIVSRPEALLQLTLNVIIGCDNYINQRHPLIRLEGTWNVRPS